MGMKEGKVLNEVIALLPMSLFRHEVSSWIGPPGGLDVADHCSWLSSEEGQQDEKKGASHTYLVDRTSSFPLYFSPLLSRPPHTFPSVILSSPLLHGKTMEGFTPAV